MKTLLMLLPVILLTGCLTRTYVVEKPRTDLVIQQGGNRGYLQGSPELEPVSNKFGDTRKVSVLEVELGPHERKNADKRGPVEPQTTVAPEPLPVIPVRALAPEKEGYQEYTVQKGDTLQKISEKFYGTTKRWQKIFEDNKDTLKSADRVYPGTKLKVWDAD